MQGDFKPARKEELGAMANVQWDDLKPSLDRAMEASKKRHANSERVSRSLSDYSGSGGGSGGGSGRSGGGSGGSGGRSCCRCN